MTPSEARVKVGEQYSYWASELPSPCLSRKGSRDGRGLLFGIDDVHEFRLEGSTPHKEAIHIRLACQLLAGCPSHRTWEGRRGGDGRDGRGYSSPTSMSKKDSIGFSAHSTSGWNQTHLPP